VDVILSPRAVANLNEIFDYNLAKRGHRAAEAYAEFLESSIDLIPKRRQSDPEIKGRRHTFAHTMTRRSKRDGHVAIYRVDEAAATITVLAVFHTKQNWPEQI
jgi:plasmid stabilization system protein ParE